MKKTHYRLGIEVTIEMIAGKWKPSIICHLGTGPQRHDELLHKINGISQKILTAQLRELVTNGIVQRIDNHCFPRKVEYQLTDIGKSLRNILIEMSLWGENRVAQLQKDGVEISIDYTDHSGFSDI